MHQRFYQPPPVLKPMVPMNAVDQPADAFKKHPISTPVERSFNLDKIPANVVVRMDGAGSARIYLNGQLVKEMTNNDRAGYVPVSLALLSPDALKRLRPGGNILKVEPKPQAGGKKKGKGTSEDLSLDVGLFEFDPGQ